jgi:SpoIID/LytB domain protein
VVRGEPLASGGGRVEVTVSGMKPVLGLPLDIFTVTAGTSRVAVTRTRGAVTSAVGSGPGVAVRWAGTRYPGSAGAIASLLDVSTSAGGLATAGHRYRYGYLDIAPTAASPTSVEVVNSVRVHDEYLLGIAEVSSSWPAASLQAQVLAARSYGLAKYGSGGLRSSCRCQVDDGGGPYYDQTFVGWSKESAAGGGYWRAAVTSTLPTPTTGLAILSAGRPITAFYFSASGGATQASQDVWVSALPYAQTVDDHWSLDPSVPWSHWIPRVRTQAVVAAAFRLADVVRIDLSDRYASGGVRTAVAWSSSGATAVLGGETFRARLSLPSTWVWRTADLATGDPASIAVSSARTSTSTTVLLAATDSPAAIALASTLSVQRGWPLLLTDRAALTPVTAAELARRNPSLVYGVGTVAELPTATMVQADALAGKIARITAGNDVDLSVPVATMLARPIGTRAVVAAADDPTSLAIASAAASATGRPLLLVPGGATSSVAVSDYLAARSTTSTLIIGSTDEVPDSVAATLPLAWRRTAADASATSTLVVSTLGIVPSRIALATTAQPTTALLTSPGVPVIVESTTVSPALRILLQRSVWSLSVAPGVATDFVTAVRRA